MLIKQQNIRVKEVSKISKGGSSSECDRRQKQKEKKVSPVKFSGTREAMP